MFLQGKKFRCSAGGSRVIKPIVFPSKTTKRGCFVVKVLFCQKDVAKVIAVTDVVTDRSFRHKRNQIATGSNGIDSLVGPSPTR
jgi:hypothetical protein